jgi:Tat protein secretion system quality control protein TatD with DNase activity
LTSYWKSYGKKQESIFLQCEQEKVERFKKYGFTLVDFSDKTQWPLQVRKLHIAVGISPSDVKRFKLQSMRIDKAIAGSLQKTLSQD